MSGWIKLHRSLKDWEWYKDSNTKSLFIHLLLNANYEDKIWNGILIKRGQVVTSIRHLASDLGLSERNIRTSLKRLIATHEVTHKATHRLYPCNYSKL